MDEPAQRLPVQARAYWRWTGMLQGLGVLAGGLAIASSLGRLAWVALAAGAAAILVLGGVVPSLRWQRWRYEIREDEIDLRHGLFTIRRTLVPIRRIQHVDTSSGLLQNAFGLATVIFHTAAGATEIPAVMRPEADELRGRVGALAKALDDV